MSVCIATENTKSLHYKLSNDLDCDSNGSEFRTAARVQANVEGLVRIIEELRGIKQFDLARSRVMSRAVVKDLSRSGVGLYYHEQLFPNEKVELHVNSRIIIALVVRCRYVSDNCFELGCKVLSVNSDRTEG